MIKIADIAALAQLELTPAEASAMERDLGAILAYVEQLAQMDTAGVEPLSHLGGGEGEAVWREDAARPSFRPEEALANAPAAAAGLFQVPSILERG